MKVTEREARTMAFRWYAKAVTIDVNQSW